MTREIITRRNLPHWYVPGALHFVTFRLAGTLPAGVIDDLQRRKAEWLRQKRSAATCEAAHRRQVHKRLFAVYDEYLDHHQEVDHLAEPRVAALVRRSLYHLHGEKYGLSAYCILPNHVHVLFLPYSLHLPTEAALKREPGECADAVSPLSGIMHSLKGYTGHEANKILRRKGSFWQHESYDHWVRDEDELERIVEYINTNPVKADLARAPQDWVWSSAHDRFLTDGDPCGWLRWDDS